MKLIKIAFLFLILITNSYLCNAFEVIEGEITEIAGPDDLNLDPDKVIIAIDVFGNADSIINGVEFYTDRDGLGAQTIGEGMVEKDGVSITTTTTHFIDNWSNGGGGPSFTGDDADSVSNLSEVMRDIRWSAAPSPVTIDINGLNAGSIYNVQLLFNEGADRNRGWDIAVNDELAVDNITSEGGDGFWTPENSFVYSGNFSATDDGIIAISMQNDIGGAAQVAADGNPILQGIILNSMTPSSIISFVGPLTDDESTGISPDNTYTHTISGGGAETVNGVEFELLNDATTPEDFYWDVSSVKNQLDDNNGGWDVGSSGVTGPGLQALLGSFTFNNDGAVGSNQSFTLNGLTGGQYYELRLYARKWDNSTQRQQTINFISGDITDTVTFSEDHPETEPVNMESRDQAYYISYRYTAGDDEDLIVEFTVTDDEVQGAPGSFHMYGLTNQIAAPPSDLDQDGLPDSWEERIVDNLEDLNGNAAGPGPGSGTGDFDGDGLTDLDEYEETKTNPIVADTDEDGLLDGVETNTGTYVSATNTGTDPNNADTDGDRLLDGVETNTGTLVDEEDTGTDPHDADTDGDGYGDGGEIAGGTDPHDPNSKGAIPPPYLFVDFEDNAADLSGNDNDGEVDGAVSFDVDGADGGSTSRTGASFTGGHLDFFGIDMAADLNTFEDGSYTFSCWIKPIGSAGGQGFIWGQTNQGIHNGIRNGGLLHSAHWGADWNASTVLEAEEWIHAVWTYDGAADTAAIYLNGQLDGGPTPQRAPNGGGTFVLGARNNGTEQFDGHLDDVAIWREVLPEGTIQALADGASPIGASQEDDDNDGLPDFWEEKYGVDDPEGDDDNDGLTNIEEYELRTKPNNKDTDEDGLEDGDEKIAGLNPTSQDTDNDGLDDGQEIAQGTNPTKSDTDNDGIPDGLDLDPLDPTVTIDSGTKVLVGKVTTFTGPDDLNFEPSTAVIAIDVYGNADSTINGVQFFSDRAGLGDNVTDEGVVEKDGVIVRTTSTHQIDNWSNGGGGPAFAGADADSVANLSEVMRDIRWSAAPSPLDIEMEGLIAGGLYEIQLLFNEGADRNRGWDITVNDELVVDNITSEGLQDVHTWTNSICAAYVANFTATENGTLNVSMQNDIGGMAQVASDGNPILQGIVVHLAVPPAPFEITDISVSDGIPTITFNSIPGRVYAVDSFEYNEDDQTYFWVELDDGLESNGAETSYTDEFVNRDLRVNLYRIREIE